MLDLDNFRKREWAPAVEAGGIAKPARLYDLRSTYASNQLAAGIDPFELAEIMGTSIEMIERHYGTLLSGSAASIASRQDALDAAQDAASDEQGWTPPPATVRPVSDCLARYWPTAATHDSASLTPKAPR